MCPETQGNPCQRVSAGRSECHRFSDTPVTRTPYPRRSVYATPPGSLSIRAGVR